MKELLPLLQSILWLGFALYLVNLFKPELGLLRKVLMQRLESGGQVRIGPLELGALQARVENVSRELVDLNAKVSQLFLTTMSPEMYINLRKLAGNRFGRFILSGGLKRELYHLRDIGYIEVASISSLPLEGSNLSAYIQVTDTGRRFVSLRDELETVQLSMAGKVPADGHKKMNATQIKI